MISLHGTCLSARSGRRHGARFPLLCRPPGSPVKLRAEPRGEQLKGRGPQAAARSPSLRDKRQEAAAQASAGREFMPRFASVAYGCSNAA